MKVFYKISILFILFSVNLFSQTITITVHQDTVFQTLDENFFGIQYHSNTYNDPSATGKLEKLYLKPIRIWAKVAEFHPGPGVWNWDELDRKIDEISNLNYLPVPCLYQSEEWFIGSASAPWWETSEGLVEWENAAYELANRYKDKLAMIIVFDEPNMMYPNRDYYIHFKECAQLYLRAARQIKKVDPAIQCGGPSSFGGWENGYWGKYVLAEPDGKNFLDFISCNLFISWDPNDSDDLIMGRTIWYEEAPLKIKEMLGENCPANLVLDAYNVSAVWKKDGQLWTDPRNTNIFGGIYQAAALLHAAKGGFNMTLRWETIGGYGILSWFPEFRELPPYFSWRFLIEVAGLRSGAQIIGCSTTEPPLENLLHHGNMNVSAYTVQPFAIQRIDGGISVVLINKYHQAETTVLVNVPPGMGSYEIYRFSEDRMNSCFSPLESGTTENSVSFDSPPYSISVLKFYLATKVNVFDEQNSLPQNPNFVSGYPNPFNSSVKLHYQIARNSFVELVILNLLGQKIRTLVNEMQDSGSKAVAWDGRDESGNIVPNGVYWVRLKVGGNVSQNKVVMIK